MYRCDRNAFYEYMGRELKAGEDLGSRTIECVLDSFRARSVAGAVRLSYDQARFQALIERCR